jgi:aspartyl-tRNA(Asn)/glutamyl-tRNA(Gln) amidotransferase subunit C
MAIEITDALVRHIAGLSRLAISDAELADLKRHFAKVLAFVEDLRSLDTEKVDPSVFATDAANVLREDVAGLSPGTEAALLNAPASSGPYFLVPRIIAEVDDEETP